MKYKLDTRLNFGKYCGETLKTILEDDPGYLVWCLENVEWFEVDQDLEDIIYEAYDWEQEREMWDYDFNINDYID